MKNKTQNFTQITELSRVTLVFLMLFCVFIFSAEAQQSKPSPTPANQTPTPNNSTAEKKAILSFKDTDKMFQILNGKWVYMETDCSKAFAVKVSSDRKIIKLLYPKADGKEEKESVFNVSEVGSYYIRGQYAGEKRLGDDGKPQVWDFVFASANEFHWHRVDWKGLALTPSVTRCSEVTLAANAPLDSPVQAKADQVKKFEEAIKPYIQKAKDSYPEARQRYLKGLPAKHTFFITTRLHDKAGRFEQVFIAVREIKDGIVKGIIASDIQIVSGYSQGETYSFPEGELIDWTISKPDGSEEGNFVGKFLDTYQP